MDTNQTNRTNQVAQHPLAQWRGHTHPILLFALLLLTACGSGGARSTPTPFPTPIVPEKPTYTVQRGTVVKSLEFRGRVSPVTEKELFFETGGYVRAVHAAQGDLVEAGDLLAELEIGDLENQLALAQVALQTTELKLSQAEQDNADARAEAEINVQKAGLQLSQAEQDHADARAEAKISLQKAELQLSQAEQDHTDALAEAQRSLKVAHISQEGAEKANERQLAEAQRTLEAAQIRLAQLQEEPDPVAIELLRLSWDREKNHLWNAQLERDAVKGQSGVPEYVRTQMDIAVSNAEIAVREAELRYQEALQSAASEDNIRLQQIEVERAKATLEQLQEGVDPKLRIDVQRTQQELDRLQEGVDPLWAQEVELAELRLVKLERGLDPQWAQAVELAELRLVKLKRGVNPQLAQEVEKARIDLQRIQGRIEDARLVAPFDGRILSLSVREGGQEIAFKSALILGDPGALEITADLGADKLTQMSVGQAATIRLLDRPEQDWSGHVRQLPYPYGGGGGGQTDGDPATRITLDDPNVTLEIGELATVIILLEQKDDVLWLPPAAIRSFQGRDFVVIQDGDHQWRADVRLGLESEERIEILEGLEEEQVAVGP